MTPESKIPPRTPPVGARVHKTIRGVSEWRETRVRGTQSSDSTVRLERDQEVDLTVLAAHDAVIDRATVTYPRAIWGPEKLGVDGKSFVVERTGGEMKVSLAPSGKASNGEIGRVLAEYPDLGRSDRLIEALSGPRLEVGIAIPALDAVVLDWLWELTPLRGQGRADSFKMAVKLRTIRKGAGEEAVFDVTIDSAKPPVDWTDPSERLRGSLVVRKAQGWPIAFDIEGPFKEAFPTLDGKVSKTGTLKLSLAWTYELPAP